MYSLKLVSAVAFALCINVLLFAVNLQKAEQFLNHKDWNFVENKGQLASSGIQYFGHKGGVYLYCQPGKISFVFTKVEKKQDGVSEATGQPGGKDRSGFSGRALGGESMKYSPSKITANRADLVLINSNPAAEIVPSDRQEYYENYYNAENANHGITNVHTYKIITYKDIYPHIDMVLHSKQNGMEYEFVVHPGGKVSDIQLKWSGLENLEMTKKGGIEYALNLGRMDEGKPVSFQGKNTIGSEFVNHNEIIGFMVGQYDKSKLLVIDPYLVWSTYYGGSSVDAGECASTDTSGNVYIIGQTSSVLDMATSGAFQTSGGMPCVFLAKFSSSGNLLWGTYYGGNGTIGYAVSTDVSSGSVYITGQTSSSNGIATQGAYQTIILAGATYGFLAKFSSIGTLLLATYVGGNKTTCATGVSAGPTGVYVTGYTASSTGLATKGAYKSFNIGSYFDAFLAKFNSSGALDWATYYGGSKDERAFAVSTDASGDAYISGWTQSDSGIATSGAYQTAFEKDYPIAYPYDLFVAKFNSSGNLLWATYFGTEEDGYDLLNNISANASGDIYVLTNSETAIATSGAYQTAPGGVFVGKFNSYGSLLWATYYGGRSADFGFAICSDASGNVFVTGYTETGNRGIATSDAYQATFAGGASDAFLAQFNSSGNLLWGTYYGGNGTDEGTGVSADASGNVFVTGWTNSDSGIATTGAFQTSLGGGFDAFLAKFSFQVENDAGISTIISPKDSFCPDSVLIKVRLKNFGTYELDSVKIGWSVNGKAQKPYNWSGKLLVDSSVSVTVSGFTFSSGTDTIKAWTSMPNGKLDSFPGNDTAQSIIYIYTLPNAEAGPDTTLCYGQTYTMQGSGGVSYLWTPAKYLNNDTLADAKAILSGNQLYSLIVHNGYGCADSSQVLLKVRPKLQVAAATNAASTCYGQDMVLSAIARGGDSLHYQFNWISDSLIGNPVTKKVYQSGWHKVILTDNCTPISDTDSVYVSVIISPTKAAFGYDPATKIKTNNNVSFINQSTNASSYLWTFGTNDSSKATSPVYIYTDTGDYQITLVAYGLNNCPNDTAFGFIKIISDQVTIYIPNAFSPNGDGVNDVFDISGIGIKSYSYNIYNRWGEQIFQTSSGQTPPLGGLGAAQGWDGNFKGVQAPEGVYIYTIDVTDVDGIHHYLNGNVTLMR